MDDVIETQEAARQQRFAERHIEIIAGATRLGATRRAAANAAGFSKETFRARMAAGERDIENGLETINTRLYLAVEKAEADAELAFQEAFHKAAIGYDKTVKREVVRTILRTYKTKDEHGNVIEKPICRTIKHPDGRVEEIPIEFEEKTSETVEGAEFDWRAAESYLRRRRPRDYGDRQEITGPEGGPIGIPMADPVLVASALQKLREAGIEIEDTPRGQS